MRGRGGNDVGIVGLVGRLSDQAQELAALEVRLVRAELASVVRRAGIHVAMAAAAVLLGLMAAGAGVAFAILLLAEAMPGWAAALVVCVALGLVAAGLGAVAARGLLRAPAETRERIEEDVRWTTRS